MFFELDDGSLLNLNKAWKISIRSNNLSRGEGLVIAQYGNEMTEEVLYKGKESECQAILKNFRESLDLVSVEKIEARYPLGIGSARVH